MATPPSIQRPCKFCGTPIQFVRTKLGKIMPLDTGIVHLSDPNALLFTVDNGVAVRTDSGIGFLSHWATCPKANAARAATDAKRAAT